MKFLFIILLLSFSFSKEEYVAVMTLKPMGLTEQEANILSERLTNNLIALKKYIVIERSNVDKIMKEQKFQMSGCTDTQCAVKIGELLNSNYIVIGSTSKFGSTYTIDCRIIDVETSEALSSASFSHKGDIDELLGNGLDIIAHKLYEIPYTNNAEQISTKQDDDQKLIVEKLNQLEKKIDKANKSSSKKGSRPKSDPSKVYDIADAGSVTFGNPNAKVTIIKWTDFQ